MFITVPCSLSFSTATMNCLIGSKQDIVSVAAGAETSAAVTSTGVLLVWGCNFRGRLGISPSTSAAPRPQVSTALSKLGVQQAMNVF